MWRLALLTAVVTAACTFDPTGEGEEGTCRARCEGGSAITCPNGPTGEAMVTPCPGTCVADPAPRCEAGRLAPSNLNVTEAQIAEDARGTLRISADVTFDSSIGQFVEPGSDTTVTFDGVVIQNIDSSRILVAAQTVTIDANVTLYGRGSRAVVLVGADRVDVLGTIDFRPGCAPPNTDDPRCGGPGGGDGGDGFVSQSVSEGCARGQAGVSSGGGAGGGHATEGGTGAPGNGATAPGASVAACMSATPLVPLHGGSGGGRGAATGASGGGGGGAIQLTSFGAISIGGGARINVGGGGGRGASSGGGGGGGSGGAILLEAPTVTIADASLLAAGGGGGAGRQSADGDDATADGSVALGGDSSPGGDGGDGATNAGSGSGGQVDGSGGGGGGGGLGHVRVHTASGSFMPAGSVLIRGVLSSATITLR